MRIGRVLVLCIAVFIAAGSMTESAAYNKIGEEDELQLSVWGHPELTVTVPVRPGGMVSVPFVGEIKAGGLTPQELKELLEKEFGKFIKTPSVSIVITKVNSYKIYVLGDGLAGSTEAAGGATSSGATSGAITLKRDTTLIQLLSLLGFKLDADLKNAYLMREGKKLPNDFYKLVRQGDVSQDLLLQPNDVIFVPLSVERRIKVIGAVKSPGMLPYIDGMTVLDAILNTGGFTEFASQNSVVIIRKEGEETKHLEVRMKEVIRDGDLSKNLPLKPGDIVRVKTGIF